MTNARILWLSAAVVAPLAALPLWSSPYLNSFLISVFMYVALSGAWNLFSGMTGYISLGHGLFFGLGAYGFAAATVLIGLHPVVGFVAAAAVPSLAALLLGFVLLTTRIRVAYFAIVMLGFNEIIKTLVANTKVLGSTYGLTIPPLGSPLVAYYVLLALALSVTLFAYALDRMRWGYGLKAILADEVAAEMTGVGTVEHKTAVFVASAFFAGLTGGMIAWHWSYIDPYMAFDLIISFEMVVMAIFGGAGTVLGPVLGAVIMSSIKEVLSTSLPNLHTIVFGVLVLVLIIRWPGGMIQLFAALARRFATAK